MKQTVLIKINKKTYYMKQTRVSASQRTSQLVASASFHACLIQ